MSFLPKDAVFRIEFNESFGSKERAIKEVRFADLKNEIKERPMKERDKVEVRKDISGKYSKRKERQKSLLNFV